MMLPRRGVHTIDPRAREEHVRLLEQAGIDVADAQRRGQLGQVGVTMGTEVKLLGAQSCIFAIAYERDAGRRLHDRLERNP